LHAAGHTNEETHGAAEEISWRGGTLNQAHWPSGESQKRYPCASRKQHPTSLNSPQVQSRFAGQNMVSWYALTQTFKMQV